MLEWVPQLVELLNGRYNTVEQRNVVLRYILLNGHTLDLSHFVHQLIEQSPEHKTKKGASKAERKVNWKRLVPYYGMA